jgi:iron complex outermembrane recepter protein
VTDLGFGVIAGDGKYELDVLARNAFDTKYTTSISGAGTDRLTYDGIGQRRWVGLVLHARL